MYMCGSGIWDGHGLRIGDCWGEGATCNSIIKDCETHLTFFNVFQCMLCILDVYLCLLIQHFVYIYAYVCIFQASIMDSTKGGGWPKAARSRSHHPIRSHSPTVGQTCSLAFGMLSQCQLLSIRTG